MNYQKSKYGHKIWINDTEKIEQQNYYTMNNIVPFNN